MVSEKISPDKLAKEDLFSTEELTRNLGKASAVGGVALFVGQGASFLIRLVSTIVLARLLVPDDFGLMAMVLPFAAILAFLSDSGLHLATIQQDEITQGQINTLFWFHLMIGIVLMLVLSALAIPIADFYGREELVWIAIASGFNILLGSVSIQHSALLKRRMNYSKLMSISIIAQLTGLLAGIGGAVYGLRFWSLVLMMVATTLVTTVLTWVIAGFVPGRPKWDAGAGRMLRFGSGVAVSNLIYQLSMYIDGVLIGRMLGAQSLGLYDRAKQLILVPLSQLNNPVGNLTISSLSRLTGEPLRYANSFRRIQEKLLIATALVCSIGLVHGDLIAPLLLGPQWKESGPIMQVMAVGGMITPASASLSWLLITQGRSKDLANWAPISLILRCLAIAVGVQWGILGVAVGLSVSQFVGFVFLSLWTGRKGAVTAAMIWVNIRPAVVAGLVSVVAGLVLRQYLPGSPVETLVLGIAVVTTFFCVTLGLFPSGRAAVADTWAMAGMALGRSEASR